MGHFAAQRASLVHHPILLYEFESDRCQIHQMQKILLHFQKWINNQDTLVVQDEKRIHTFHIQIEMQWILENSRIRFIQKGNKMNYP